MGSFVACKGGDTATFHWGVVGDKTRTRRTKVKLARISAFSI